MDRKEIIDRLKDLDRFAFSTLNDNKRYSCVIVGGGALLLLGYSYRVTMDIDFVYNNFPKELIELMDKINMNSNATAYIDCFADGYIDRAKPVTDFEPYKIDFYTLSPEDFVVSKLSSGRSKDIIDIKNQKLVEELDFELLNKLVEETKLGLINDRLVDELQIRYEQYLTDIGKEEYI
ncbi:MAG: DUF6036 family nucleotidyltransferase [Acutalibacteraceae bacterium]